MDASITKGFESAKELTTNSAPWVWARGGMCRYHDLYPLQTAVNMYIVSEMSPPILLVIES